MQIKRVTYRNNQLSSVTYRLDRQENMWRLIDDQDANWGHFIQEHKDSLARFQVQDNTRAFLEKEWPEDLSKVASRPTSNKYKHYYGVAIALVAIAMFIHFVIDFSGDVSAHFGRQGRLLVMTWDLNLFTICVVILTGMYLPKDVKSYSRRKKARLIIIVFIAAMTILFAGLLLFGLVAAML